MRNQALPGIKKLMGESPLKDRDPYRSHPHPHVPKPPKKEENKPTKKNTAPPPPKGPTTKIYKRGGGQIGLTEPN